MIGVKHLTEAEKSAVIALETLAKTWPRSLWLFSASGQLHVMRKNQGERALNPLGGMDSDFVVATIQIENDGGDW